MGKVGWGCRSYLISFSVECMCGGRAYHKLDFHLLEKISRRKTLIRAILSEIATYLIFSLIQLHRAQTLSYFTERNQLIKHRPLAPPYT